MYPDYVTHPQEFKMVYIYDASLQLSLTKSHELSSVSTTELVYQCVKSTQGITTFQTHLKAE